VRRWGAEVACGFGSAGQCADLDQVVGENPVSAPDPGAVDAAELAAIPSVSALECADAAFGSGAPLDQSPEGSSMLELAPGRGRFSLARDDDVGDAEGVQVVLDAGLAVAAVGGDRPRWLAGAGGNPGDRRCQLGCIRRGADLDGVVQDDAVGVVHHLGLVAELHRLAQPALTDRPGVGIVQADQPTRPVRIMRSWANYFKHAVCKHIFSKLAAVTWWRVIRWQMQLHRWRWKDVRRRFTGPTGAWKPITADGIEMFNIAAVPVRRYRYRGNTIPNPWKLPHPA
jgi:Group II intron, maturase-specific domain